MSFEYARVWIHQTHLLLDSPRQVSSPCVIHTPRQRPSSCLPFTQQQRAGARESSPSPILKMQGNKLVTGIWKALCCFVQISIKREIHQIQPVRGELGAGEGGEERDLGWKFHGVVFKGFSELSLFYYHLTNSLLSQRGCRYLFWPSCYLLLEEGEKCEREYFIPLGYFLFCLFEGEIKTQVNR